MTAARYMAFFLAAAVAVSPSAAQAPAGPEALTYMEFLNGATASNPEIFSQLEKLRISAAVEHQARAIDDIILSVTYRHLYDRPYQEYSPFRIHTDRTDGASADAAWTFSSLGTRMRAGISYGRRDLELEEMSLLPPYPMTRRSLTVYGPDLFVEVQQPLLRNWLGVIDRYPLRHAGLSRLVMRSTVDEAIETIHADLVSLYIRWYLAWHRCRVFTEHVRNSRELLRQITERHARGLADEPDLERASLSVLEYGKGLEQHRAIYSNLTARVYRWYANRDRPDASTMIAPAEEMTLGPVPQEISVCATRQMRILSLTGKILSARLDRDRSALLPELNAVFSFHLRNYDESAAGSLAAYDYNTYAAGLTLTYPLGNSVAAGQIGEGESQLRQWAHDVDCFTRNYERSVADVRELLASQERILETDAELLRHAQAQVRAQEKKYSEARGDLYFLIQARNDLLSYELALVTDTARYRELVVQILGLADMLYPPGGSQ